MSELFSLLFTSTLETLDMVSVAAVLCAAGGLVLGILLVVSAPGRVLSAPAIHKTLTILTNFGRSIPFIIVVVAIVVLSHLGVDVISMLSKGFHDIEHFLGTSL